MRGAIANAKDVIMHLELLTFGIPEAAMRTQLDGIPTNLFADANYQIASAEGNSTLCCNNTDPTVTTNPTNPHTPVGTLKGTLAGLDIAYMNGGYQPIVSMHSGEWQRWR